MPEGIEHWHVNVVGPSQFITSVVLADKKEADNTVLKMTEVAYYLGGVYPIKIANGIVYLDDGSTIKTRSCTKNCLGVPIIPSQEKHLL